MRLNRIVRGQPVSEEKVLRAKELRKEMTPAESILWQQLRGNKLHGLHFRRQQLIHGLIADFYCHAAALVVEVDGQVHKNLRDQDADRDRICAEQGLLVLRFTNEQVHSDLGKILKKIARVCADRIEKV